MSTELTKSTQYSIEKAQSLLDMSVQLKQFIEKNELVVKIKGKPWAMAEAWQFLGANLGIVAIVESCERVSETEVTYKACAHLMRLDNNQMIGRGEAYCSKSEYKKRDFEEYAIASTAQTRAIGKAYRNVFGWMMKAAGYNVADEPNGGKEVYSSPEDDGYATRDQIKKIKDLVKSHHFENDEQVARLISFIEPTNRLPKNDASDWIDWLLKMLKKREREERELNKMGGAQ